MVAPRSSEVPAATTPTPSSLRGTALTLGGFFCCAAVLSVLPRVPSELRPLALDAPAGRTALVAKLTTRPKMTLAEHEKKLEGQLDVPDVKEDAEDAELHRESNGAEDLVVLAGAETEQAQPAAESDLALPAVDRAAVAARALPKALAQRAHRSHERHKALGMQNAAIENPCVEKSPEGCVRTALDPFFATLDAIVRGDNEARADVVILGNSLIASDHVTDILRDELQARFGDGGRGFLLVDRLSKVAGRRVRTGTASDGWNVRHFAQDPPLPTGVRFGFTGALHESSVDGDVTRWALDRATRARLSWLDTGAGLRLTVDGVEVLRVPKAKKEQATQTHQSIEVRLPPLAKELRLTADKGARVYGVAVEREVAGVLVDTIGVPAASARLYVDSTDEQLFVEQIAAREPALVTLMLGGNETRGISYGNTDEKRFEEKLSILVDRLKKAAPTAACLLVTPIDAAKTTTGSDELVTREEIFTIMAVQRRVAEAKGCAVFDMFSAMGGKGSLARMREAGFVSDDLVHPTNRGGDILGQLFADAMVKSWVDTPASDDDVPIFRRRKNDEGRPRYAGLSFPSEERITAVVVGGDQEEQEEEKPAPLTRFFARLSELEHGDRTRVAIGQFGASHTAGQMLTDRMRERLGARFGSLGRGFVSVGKASKRLAPSGVFRELVGAAEVADGRDVVLGGALGMSGTKTRLLPGARARIGFCQGCNNNPPLPSEENGRLQLAWLYTPDMGTADVLVDGVNVATLRPDTRRAESDVQFLSLPVRREKATLEVVSRREPLPVVVEGEEMHVSPVGPVHLLSVVEEMDRRGIVLDAVGLPGTTGMTPQRWRQDLYAEEVKARRYDLIVTAWGTNEAGIGSLDEATYRHHFGATLDTLLAAAPGADCLIIGASDRFDEKHGAKDQVWVQAPSHDLVERVQKDLAAERGCAFFSMRQAMGGPGSMKQWVKDGLGHSDHVHFTREGYEKLGDMVIEDLLAAWGHWQKKQQKAEKE